MSRQAHDICSVVVSHLPHDARAWKEARSLAAAGYSVRLLGLRYGIARPRDRIEGRIEVRELPFGRRGGSALWRALSLLRLWWNVIRARARVYHCHNVHPGPAVLLAARLRGATVVYDAHELYGEARGTGWRPWAAARLAARMQRSLVGAAATTLTTNASRARLLADRYGEPVKVLGNFPPRWETVEPFDPGYPQESRILLYQGGVYARERAFRETMEALRELDRVDLVVVGFGRARDLELVRSWAREIGVREKVHLLGALPFDELVRAAAAAAVGLVPLRRISTNSYLGDTNKLFDYLMAGLPVVGSDFPEIRAVLGQGSPPVGEVFDPDSPGSIAAAVRSALDGRYERRRVEARRLALERFNWALEERKLLSLYRDLASAPEGRRLPRASTIRPGPQISGRAAEK